MQTIHEELETLADEMQGTPLIICDFEVDKTDIRQVYGALCWIERNLGALLSYERERNGNP